MNTATLPLSPSHAFILLACGLFAFSLALLFAYTAPSSRGQYQYKLLELELKESQMNSRLSEKEHSIAAKDLNAQISFLTGENKRMVSQTLALAKENDEMRRQLLALEEQKQELATLVAQKEDEYVTRRSELEEVWLEERADIRRGSDLMIEALRDDLQTMAAFCASKDDEMETLTNKKKEEFQGIRRQYERRIFELTKQLSEGYVEADGDLSMGAWCALVQAADKRELRDICGRQEQMIWELNEKLSECHRRLSAGQTDNSAYPAILNPTLPQSLDSSKRDPRATV